MSEGGGDIDDNLKNHVKDAVQQTTKLNDATPRNSGEFNEDNVTIPNDTQDQLMQMMVELKFQNEYLKSHFQDLNDVSMDSAGSYVHAKEVDHDSKELKDKIEALNEERQTRGAAEAALEHLRAEYTEADAKSQELEAKLAEGNVTIPNDTQDQLMQMVVELKFQNEYLKSHFQDLKDVSMDSAGSYVQAKEVDHDSKELKDKIEALNEERQTRGAAEAALEHLRAEYTEADAKSQELEAKLAEGDNSESQRDANVEVA